MFAVVAHIKKTCPVLWATLLASATNFPALNRPRPFGKNKTEHLAMMRAIMCFANLAFSRNQNFNAMQLFVAEAVRMRSVNLLPLLHAMGYSLGHDAAALYLPGLAKQDWDYFFNAAKFMQGRLVWLVADNIDFVYVLCWCVFPVV